MTPVEALQEALEEARDKQKACVTESGALKDEYKHTYQNLIRREVVLKECIEIMKIRELRGVRQS